MPPIRRKRRRGNTRSARCAMFEHSFDYVHLNHAKTVINLRESELQLADVNAVAYAVQNDLMHVGGIQKAIMKKIGDANFKRAVAAAKEKLKKAYFSDGEVVVLEFEAGTWVKCVFLVVRPGILDFEQAFKTIFDKAAEFNLQTIAMPAIGCGELNIHGAVMAASFHAAIQHADSAGKLNVLKCVEIMDINAQSLLQVKECFSGFAKEKAASPSGKFVETVEGALPAAESTPSGGAVISVDEISGEDCPVCFDSLKNETEVFQLNVCKHQFHNECFEAFLKQSSSRKCPVCRKFFSKPMGNQPLGSTMQHQILRSNLPGFENNSNGTIVIYYSVPGGIQDKTHLRPGRPFAGTARDAYLPNNEEGRKVLKLLEKAFECRLIFTVGDSVTTGRKDVTVWNNIHHKTNMSGGASHFGYPDETYLVRVIAELNDAGITEDLL